MHQALKNTIQFSLLVGASTTVPHGLALTGSNELTPVTPDIVFLPSPDLSVLVTSTEITLTNDGPVPISGTVLVEYWHSIERVFVDAGSDLPVKPIIVVSAELGNTPPQPAFVSPPEVITIYVRATGNDASGDGKTIPTAYRTVQRAAQDIQSNIPGGVYYIIDATGLIAGGAEVLPPNYALPAWKAPAVLSGVDFDRNNYRGAVTLHAEPRNVPALGADATIVEADLDSTAVGGAIVSASNTTPILITTTTPHGLVESPPPFGIFGVFAGVVQIVEIAGVVGNPEANGVFFALVTKPTVDESTTFELYDLDLNPVAGSGAGAGGTVTVQFVKDQHSGQVQVKLSAPRASWLPNDSLRGKMLVGDAGDTAFIYANTDDTLYLASNGTPGIFDGPVRIAEPSCVLQCSDSEVFSDDGFVGGFNVVGVDSICLSGIQVLAAPDGSGFLHSGGVCLARECSLEFPKLVLQGRFIGMESHLITPSYNRSAIEHDRCLVENVEGGITDYWDAFHGTVIIQDADHVIPSGTIDWILGVKVISQADPVFAVENGGEIRWWCGSIEGGAGDAIVIRAQGDNQLYNVGGSGWAGTALVVDVGAQVEVNAFSFLKTDEMLVGQLAARTFDDFRTSVTFPLEQFDVTYDPTAGAPTKATGTASRVFETP